MIFGRFKRKDDEERDLDEALDETDDSQDDDVEVTDELDEADDSEDDLDEWERLDASRDWREDGPFDISEVDLDADEVERLDFGCVVLTPFEGIQMQLQVDQRLQLQGGQRRGVSLLVRAVAGQQPVPRGRLQPAGRQRGCRGDETVHQHWLSQPGGFQIEPGHGGDL